MYTVAVGCKKYIRYHFFVCESYVAPTHSQFTSVSVGLSIEYGVVVGHDTYCTRVVHAMAYKLCNKYDILFLLATVTCVACGHANLSENALPCPVSVQLTLVSRSERLYTLRLIATLMARDLIFYALLH